MKVKFSKFERVAGFFVLSVIVGTVASFVLVAVQKGWFESKIPLTSSFDHADGLTPGTQVQMNGLRVGSIDDVVLGENNRVTVKFNVSEKVFTRVREDSVVRTFRPFIIGDRVLEVTVGSAEAPPVKPGSTLQSVSSLDVMDLISGRELGPYMESFREAMDSMSVLGKAFMKPERVESLIGIFDQLEPTVKEVRSMAREMSRVGRQATRKQRLAKTLNNLIVSTEGINEIMPEFIAVVKNSPELGENAASIVTNLAILTEELKALVPAIAAVAPELPQASKRAIEAMNEAVITLKAMQRSFLLRGAVDDIREEEEEKLKKMQENEKERLPANE